MQDALKNPVLDCQAGDLLKLKWSAVLWSDVANSEGIDAEDEPETFQQHVICLEVKTAPHRLRPERPILATKTAVVWMSGERFLVFQNDIEAVISPVS